MQFNLHKTFTTPHGGGRRTRLRAGGFQAKLGAAFSRGP